MAGKISELTTIPAMDRAADLLEIVDTSAGTSNKVTPNTLLGISGNPVGTSDSQTLTAKTLTAPTITSPVLSGTVTGTYTLAGTPTFPSSVVTLTGSQTLTNKILTSPTISSPTITNASISADAITGFSSSNSGTLYGIAITSSKIPGTSLTNQTVGPNQLATGAQAAFVTTSEATTSTSYADLTTVTDTVTVTIGANGLAIVLLNVMAQNNTGNAQAWMSVALTGANTVAANDNLSTFVQAYTAGAVNGQSAALLITGLSPGSTTFKAKYRASTGTATFQYRRIAVVPL